MKQNYMFLFAALLFAGSLQAQTIEELRAQKADLAAKAGAAQAEVDKYTSELGGLQKEIDKLSGWRRGISGILGMNFSNAKNWVAFPNANAKSQSFTANITGTANLEREKYFWDNKLLVNQGWLSLNTLGGDLPGIFRDDTKTLDLLNLSSLAGYKLTDKLALTGLGEVNTSLNNFFKPGTVDIGLGATYTPFDNFRIVFHPLNMHGAWYSQEVRDATGDDTSFSFGAKLRADYSRDLFVVGKKVSWSSTFTGFMPYSDTEVTYIIDGVSKTISASEWTWINSLSFEVWNGIGVGVGFGLRNASFEYDETQTYYNVGLSYGF